MEVAELAHKVEKIMGKRTLQQWSPQQTKTAWALEEVIHSCRKQRKKHLRKRKLMAITILTRKQQLKSQVNLFFLCFFTNKDVAESLTTTSEDKTSQESGRKTLVQLKSLNI